MSIKWTHVIDDDLLLIDKAISFLKTEFNNSNEDCIWSLPYFKWKLGNRNPAGSGYVSLAMINQEVIGIATITKKRIILNGKLIIGAEIGDTYTSAKYRKIVSPESLYKDENKDHYLNKSIFGRLVSEVRNRAISDGVHIIYGTPNEQSYPGYTNNLDFKDCECYSNDSYLRPTWRMILKRLPLLGMFKYVFKLIDNSIILINYNLNKVYYKNLTFNYYKPSASEINRLWGSVNKNIAFSLVLDSDYWLYRYLEHPSSKFLFCGVRRSGNLVGLIVLKVNLVKNGWNKLFICDIMVEEDIPFDFILSGILNICKDFNIDVYCIYSDGMKNKNLILRKNIFFKRKKAPLIFNNTEEIEELDSAVGNFYFSLGSSDAV